MKSLHDYIIEAGQKETPQDELRTFKFDFSKFENAKETIETIVAQGEDFVIENDESTITIECKNSDATAISGILEIIKSYIKKNGSSQTRASDEQYAQFCQKQERVLDDLEQFLKPVENPEPVQNDPKEEENDDDQSDNDKN